MQFVGTGNGVSNFRVLKETICIQRRRSKVGTSYFQDTHLLVVRHYYGDFFLPCWLGLLRETADAWVDFLPVLPVMAAAFVLIEGALKLANRCCWRIQIFAVGRHVDERGHEYFEDLRYYFVILIPMAEWE